MTEAFRKTSLPPWLTTLLTFCVALVFASTFAFCLLLPIYIDDILTPAVLGARAGYDDWNFISGFAQCGVGFSQKIPLLFLPGRWLAWAIHSQFGTLFGIRAVGICNLALWAAVTVWGIRLFWQVKGWALPFIAAISWIWIGVLPGVSILTRPEMLMVCCITLFCALPYYFATHKELPLKKYALLAALFFLSCSWFFLAHAKSFFFAPLALVAALSFPKYLRWPLFAIVVTMVLQHYVFWTTRFSCDSIPAKQSIIDARAILPHMLLDNPAATFQQMFNNLRYSTRYFDYIQFSENYVSNWLPPMTLQPQYYAVNALITLFGIAMAGLLLFSAAQTIRNKGSKLHYSLWLMPLLLACIMLTLCLLYIQQSFYDSGLYWPLFMLLLVMAVAPHVHKKSCNTALKIAFIMLVSVSASSQLVLVNSFGARLYALQHEDANGVIGNGELSQSLFNYEGRKARIYETAASCGINPADKNSHVMVDVYSYLPFKQAYQPYFSRYVTSGFSGDDTVFSFLKRQQSAGVIALCASLPQELQDIAVNHDGVCCISQTRLLQ